MKARLIGIGVQGWHIGVSAKSVKNLQPNYHSASQVMLICPLKLPASGDGRRVFMMKAIL